RLMAESGESPISCAVDPGVRRRCGGYGKILADPVRDLAGRNRDWAAHADQQLHRPDVASGKYVPFWKRSNRTAYGIQLAPACEHVDPEPAEGSRPERSHPRRPLLVWPRRGAGVAVRGPAGKCLLPRRWRADRRWVHAAEPAGLADPARGIARRRNGRSEAAVH